MRLERLKEVRYCLLVAGVIFFLLSTYSCQPGHQSAGRPEASLKLFQRGVAALEAGRPQEARFWVQKAIAQRPQLAMFHYVLGQIYLAENKPDSAMQAFEEALRYKSHYPEVWQALVPLYMEKKQYDSAIPLLKDLVARFPDSLGFRLRLAESYIRDGSVSLGLDQLNPARQHAEKAPEIYFLSGMAYLKLEKYRKAISEFELYLQARPEDYRAVKLLGVAYLKNSEPEKGMSLLNRALQVKPDDAEVFLYRGAYFWQNDKIDAAETQVNRALSLDSLLAEGYGLKAKIVLARKDTASAFSLLEQALKLKPHCTACMRQLGMLYFEKNQPENARIWLDKFMKTSPAYDAQVDSVLTILPPANQ